MKNMYPYLTLLFALFLGCNQNKVIDTPKSTTNVDKTIKVKTAQEIYYDSIAKVYKDSIPVPNDIVHNNVIYKFQRKDTVYSKIVIQKAKSYISTLTKLTNIEDIIASIKETDSTLIISTNSKDSILLRRPQYRNETILITKDSVFVSDGHSSKLYSYYPKFKNLYLETKSIESQMSSYNHFFSITGNYILDRSVYVSINRNYFISSICNEAESDFDFQIGKLDDLPNERALRLSPCWCSKVLGWMNDSSLLLARWNFACLSDYNVRVNDTIIISMENINYSQHDNINQLADSANLSK